MQPARSLDQIIGEIRGIYDPQIESVRQRQAAIPGQIQAEEQGLQAKQQRAFGDILSGARRRGLGFSGIPLGEQAQYTATEYLPALARLRQSGQEQARSLEDAILGINERMQNQALALRQYEQQRYDTWLQQQAEMAFQREQAEKAARAAAALASPSFGGAGAPAQKADPYASVDKNRATDAVLGFLKSNNLNTIRNSINAITASANRGNVYDQFKLQLINYYRNNSGYGNLINRALGTKGTSSNTSIPLGPNTPNVVARF